MIGFYGWTALTLVAGFLFFFKGKGGYLFAGLSGILFLIAATSIFSFISLYVYELPTHHCPFCVLQREYGYVGYPPLRGPSRKHNYGNGGRVAHAFSKDRKPEGDPSPSAEEVDARVYGIHLPLGNDRYVQSDLFLI